MKKLDNNLFYSVEKINGNVFRLKSNFNLNTQVNGLCDCLVNNNFEFLINDYELTLFTNEKKLNDFINGCTLV